MGATSFKHFVLPLIKAQSWKYRVERFKYRDQSKVEYRGKLVVYRVVERCCCWALAGGLTVVFSSVNR